MVVAPKIEGAPSDEKSFMPLPFQEWFLLYMFNLGLLSHSPAGLLCLYVPKSYLGG